MPSITIRGLSEPLHSELKAAAEDSRRSLNSELLHRLEISARVPSPGEAEESSPGPPEGWRPDPPTIPLEVRESGPGWGRSRVDATVSPIVVALKDGTLDRDRRSLLLVASEAAGRWLALEGHWVRAEGEEVVPPGTARISIAGLARAELDPHTVLDRADVVALVADMALDALREVLPSPPPMQRINRFDPAPPAALLRLRIDPVTRAQLEDVRSRTRIGALRDALERLLGIDVQVGGFDASPNSPEPGPE